MKTKGKKGVEMTFQTLAIVIIGLIVLILLVYFFSKHYGGIFNHMVDNGTSAIDSAKKGLE